MNSYMDTKLFPTSKILKYYRTLGYPNNLVLPDTMTHFRMEDWFNNPITLPDTLLYLTMGDAFNTPLILPNNLLYLMFGNDFNQSVQLPDTLLRLDINPNYEHLLALPDSLLYLSMGFGESDTSGLGLGLGFGSLKVLPKKLRFLACYANHMCNFILPETLETIIFIGNFFKQTVQCDIAKCVDHMPDSVKTIVFDYSFHPELYLYANIPHSVKYIMDVNNIYCLEEGDHFKMCGTKTNIRFVEIGGNNACVLGDKILFEIMNNK